MKLINWLKGIFDKNSNVSSKRFIGVTLVVWAITIATYYIIKIQNGGKESDTTKTIIEFAIVSGVGLLAGGTIAERINLNKDNNTNG
jgi:uncharacterized membrane protein YhiD involved in acid resistance